MESRIIGLQQVKVAWFVFRKGEWTTSREVTRRTKVPLSTVQLHLRRLVAVGLLDRVRSFGGCRYRARSEAELDDRALAYLARLAELRQTFQRRSVAAKTLSAMVAMMPV